MKTNIIGTAKLFWHVLVEGQSGPEVTWAYNKESDRLNSMGIQTTSSELNDPTQGVQSMLKGISFLFFSNLEGWHMVILNSDD